jgi:hypothetical protein
MASVIVFRVECKLLVGLRGDWDQFVFYGRVALQSALVHTGQHGLTNIGVIVNLDNSLSVVEAVQTAYVLLEGPFPGDWHRQEKCIEPCIVKTFADIASY